MWPVDAFTVRSIIFDNVATLYHKQSLDFVETGAFIVQRFATGADSLFTRAQATKILSSFRGHIFSQLDYYTAHWNDQNNNYVQLRVYSFSW